MILHWRTGAWNPVCFSLGNTFPGDYMTIAQPPLFSEKSCYLLRLHSIHVTGHIDNVYAMINFTALYLHFSFCFTSWQRIFFTILERYLRQICIFSACTIEPEESMFSEAKVIFCIFDILNLFTFFPCYLFSLVQHWGLWRCYLSPRRSWCCFH